MLQYFLNLAMWSDLTLSTLLGGNPRDTVSARIARARASGSRPACFACKALTFISVRVFQVPGDHCTNSLDPHAASVAREIWDWGDVPSGQTAGKTNPPSEANQ